MNAAPTLEIALLTAAYVGGIVAVGMAARWIVEAVGPRPALAEVVFWALVLVGGIGGVVAFVLVLTRVEFLWRGHEIGFRDGEAYYSERDASGGRRKLAFEWIRLTEGYRPRYVVRLPGPESWDDDTPPWAWGRRDEIADRITRQLTSYEGWPAILMPDLTVVDSTSGAAVTTALIRAVLDDCPDWAAYLVPPIDGAHLAAVLISVPPPEHPTHRLEVVYLGEAFEVGYHCGQLGLRAAAQFGPTPGASAGVVFCVCEFLRELREGEMVVLVRPLDLFTRWRRGDGVCYGARFRSVSRSVGFSPRSIYAWHSARRPGDLTES